MKELMEELDTAFRLMSSVPVTGDAIDLMAGARAKLRHVFEELKKMDESEEKNNA